MVRKVSKITCAASFLVFLALVLWFGMRLGRIWLFSPNGPSIAIIGGADGPTAKYLIRTIIFGDPLFIAVPVSFALFVVSLVVWLVKRSHNPYSRAGLGKRVPAGGRLPDGGFRHAKAADGLVGRLLFPG